MVCESKILPPGRRDGCRTTHEDHRDRHQSPHASAIFDAQKLADFLPLEKDSIMVVAAPHGEEGGWFLTAVWWSLPPW
jgi:hypothetical protein